jgi:hypothetical protein
VHILLGESNKIVIKSVLIVNNSEYEKILKKGDRIDWYGTQVPKDLITQSVVMWAETLSSEIHLLEGELSDLRGTELDKRKGYLAALYNNLRNAPYAINGDFYLIKKKRIELEIEEEEKSSKPIKRVRAKTTTPKKTTSKTTTKNSDLIFGKK